MPFLQLAMSQIAANHLSRPSGESSKIVPTRTENCLPHSLFRHFHIFRVEMNPHSVESQNGQITPFGQRKLTANAKQFSESEKYRMASVRVFNSLGGFVLLAM